LHSPLYFFRKPLVAVSLACTALLLTAFLAQYYTWMFVVEVHPLTESFTVTRTTTGSTISDYHLIKTTWVRVIQNGVYELKVELSPEEKAALEEAFVNLRLKVEVEGVGSYVFEIVKDGVAYSPLSTTFSLPAGTYTVKLYLQYETKPVTTTIHTSYTIKVCLMEV